VVVDLGTGDGRAVLARAAAEPTTLVVGIDASAAAMAEASRRADRARRGNVIFLAAGAETLPGNPLTGIADLVTVQFPWGSLLCGMLGLDGAALAGVASIMRPGGAIEVFASVVPADGLAGMEALDADAQPGVAAAWASVGLRLDAMCPATAAEIAAISSSWARRLGAGAGSRADRTDRPAWRLTGTRVDASGQVDATRLG
jgi:16S rRNA (adenine(1408)-N(1))-methyltransferase